MKKVLALITLGIAIVAMAQEQQPIDDATLKMFILQELCSGHHPPFETDENGMPIPVGLPTAEGIAKGHNIPRERMARILEEMLRDNLPALERGVLDAIEVSPLIWELQTFHNANTLALLEECAMSSDKNVRDNAIVSYISIAKAESIPFLRKAFAEGRVHHSWGIYNHLEGITQDLKSNGKTDDAEKFYAFLKEMTQAEQNPFSVKKIEDILHANADASQNNARQANTIYTNQGPPVKDDTQRILPPRTEAPENPATETSGRKPNHAMLWGIAVAAAVIGGTAVWRKRYGC